MLHFLRLFIIAASLMLLPSCDPWEDIRPYWGKRPGRYSYSFSVNYHSCKVSAHLLRDADAWVQAQRQRFTCVSSPLNDTDEALLAKLERGGETCTVWRSTRRYDIAFYQAVQPTFICFDDGECLFYLYDDYSSRLDVIPPACEMLAPLAEQQKSPQDRHDAGGADSF